ncbi:MAG: hypothetical protein RBR02_07045 [Desulfuromonadaceae bacterium]|nr:hypothetical protein [Desulfuromonadaceae bacterium]
MPTPYLHKTWLLCLVIFTLLFPARPSMSQAEVSLNEPTGDKSFEQQEPVDPPGRQGNILNIVLGSTPERSTERGTLVMEAYHDADENGEYTQGEALLRNEISCTVDGVRYTLPAFVPGLDYNARYKIKCQGLNKYEPTTVSKNVLIARRGEVISISIPCNLVEE